MAACGLAEMDLEGMVEAVHVLPLQLGSVLPESTKPAVPLLGHELMRVLPAVSASKAKVVR